MDKYYRVIKDNPLWEEGAILQNGSNEGKGYDAVEDVWHKNKHADGSSQSEYLSDYIVENQPDFFERVYPSKGKKALYITAAELKKAYGKFKK